MGKAVTLDLSEFIGKKLDLVINKDSQFLNDLIKKFTVLSKFQPKHKLKSTILNILPERFMPSSSPRWHKDRMHIYSCLIVTNKYNYILKFTSTYIIQYITIGHINYKRIENLWVRE